MDDQSHRISLRAWVACLISAIFLGISQPLFMPQLFSESSAQQSFLGLLVLIAYVPWFLVVRSKDLRATFILIFTAMTLQFSVVLYWIYIALHVHGHISPVPAALITVVLPMILALKGALFFTMGRFLSMRFNLSFLVIAPAVLCSCEYFKNFYIFGGFPWGNAGYSLSRIDEFLQLTSLFGVYGLVFFIGLINSLWCWAWLCKSKGKSCTFACSGMMLILLGYLYGAIRLSDAREQFAPSLRVALLQGNISQERKSASRLYAEDILAIYTDLFERAKDDGAELIVWPESAYPYTVDQDIRSWELSKRYNVASVVGATTYGRKPDGHGYYAHNSAFLIDGDGLVIKRYDKSHLVPFGEYVPWPMTGVVDKIVPGLGAFVPGVDFSPVELAIDPGRRVEVGATICYEGIFPEISRTYAKRGASLLINLTNDAWYGYSSAPYQHLLMYRVRSVESGLPFLRATNSGISAIITPYGHIQKSLGLFERGLVIDELPLVNMRTIYRALGDVLPMCCIVLLILGYTASVLPVRGYLKHGQWGKLLFLLFFLSVLLAVHIYYSQERFMADESARTKELLAFLVSFMFILAVLSKSRRSRSILMISSSILILASLALTVLESFYFAFGIAFGLLIYLLAFRIRVNVNS